MDNAAILVKDSDNKKIRGYRGARVCITYSSIEATCPRTCKLYKTKECYGMYGRTSLILKRLDAGVTAGDSLQVTKVEAQKITDSFKGGTIPQDGAKGGRDLRLHTVGDTTTNRAAKYLAAAADHWYARGGGRVWTYTHAWQKIDRRSWGSVSVLASVDKPEDVRKARARGYVPAKYVADFPSKRWKSEGTTWIACPAQVRDNVGCADCRLCMNDQQLRSKRMGIAFEAHGSKGTAMKKRLGGV